MLIKGFFEAVERAFTKDLDRIPLPTRLELKTPLELPLPTPESTQAPSPSDRRRLLQSKVCNIEQTAPFALRYAAVLKKLGVKWVPAGQVFSVEWVTAGFPLAVRRAPLSEGVESHRFFSVWRF
jgi:hypothetical protein